jgi:hypothetical protein
LWVVARSNVVTDATAIAIATARPNRITALRCSFIYSLQSDSDNAERMFWFPGLITTGSADARQRSVCSQKEAAATGTSRSIQAMAG